MAALTLATPATAASTGSVQLLRLALRRTIAAFRSLFRIGKQRFVADELVTVLLQNCAGEGLAAHHEHGLAVFLELVDQRDEIAVAADDGERIHMLLGGLHTVM